MTTECKASSSEEPGAGIPHAGICAGGARQRASLPRYQLLVKTSTGIWQVTYNAENRPVVWSNETAVITMDFDRMGRRVWYTSVSGGETNTFAKFVYDGYLCILQLDGFTGDVEQEFVWDPTEPVATRPLKWTLPGLGRTFHYFHDGNKNVSDVVDAADSTLAAHYDYAPFGAVTTATGPMANANPYRFSSEYHDPALGCVYYNYRHYNPLDGRWTTRDPIEERDSSNLSIHTHNCPVCQFDYIGLNCVNYGPPIRADTIVKALGNASRVRWTFAEAELKTEKVIPYFFPAGGFIHQRQYCRCKCNVTIETYAFSIKCERWEQPKQCEVQGLCGPIRWTTKENLGWTGGVTKEFVNEKYIGQQFVTAPYYPNLGEV